MAYKSKIVQFSIIFVVLGLFPSLVLADWNAYATDAGVKYRPWDTTPTSTTLNIDAARGQWAAFQVAADVSGEDVTGVDVSATTPSKGSNQLDSPLIYKEETYNVLVKSRDDGATGEWPDPLIPKVDNYYNETRNAFPFNINRVSPVYKVFDIYTPGSQPITRNNVAGTNPTISGSYSGNSQLNYHVKIDSGGALGAATFKWSSDGGVTWNQTGIVTGTNVTLDNGLTITFPNETYSSKIQLSDANDRLYFTSDSGSSYIDLTNSSISDTPAEVATLIQTKLNANTTLTGNGTITFAVSLSSGKIQIDAGTGHTISYTNSGSDAGPACGFTQNHGAAQIITADEALDGGDEWEFFSSPTRNQMVWIESYVPLDAPVGVYASSITVSATGKSNQTLSVNIAVHEPVIPKTSSIPVTFSGSRDLVCHGHFGTWQQTTQTAEDLYKRYEEAGLYHRISISGLQKYLTWDGNSIGNWSNGSTGWKDQIAPYVNGTWSWGAQLSVVKVPTVSGMKFSPIVANDATYESDLTQSEKDYLTSLNSLLTGENWMSKMYMVFVEEPTIDADQTAAINAGATSIRNINPLFKLIATKRLVNDWIGSIDVWNSWLGSFATYPRSLYDSEVSAGRQVWSYLSCMSHGCNAIGGADRNPYPSQAVDATGPNLRGYYWLMFDNDVTGDLFYSVLDGYRYNISTYAYPSPHDPWDSVYDFGAEADGNTFYPGRTNKIGGTHDIPIESIRLKFIRAGLEDYEIFKYVSDHGHEAEAKTQIENAVGNGLDHYVSPQPSYSAMKTALANVLDLTSDTIAPSAPSGLNVN